MRITCNRSSQNEISRLDHIGSSGHERVNKARPTPSTYSAHVFVGKHVNTPSRINCLDAQDTSYTLVVPDELYNY